MTYVYIRGLKRRTKEREREREKIQIRQSAYWRANFVCFLFIIIILFFFFRNKKKLNENYWFLYEYVCCFFRIASLSLLDQKKKKKWKQFMTIAVANNEIWKDKRHSGRDSNSMILLFFFLSRIRMNEWMNEYSQNKKRRRRRILCLTVTVGTRANKEEKKKHD